MEIFVRKNDTIWYFSQLFNVPMILIERSNPQVTSNQLQIGQSIEIPGYILIEYTVKRNDSLWAIAMDNNLSIDSLTLVNSIEDPNDLQINQKIFIPDRVSELIVSDFNNYTYEKMIGDIHELKSLYPFIFKQTIGQSVMEKDIIELQIGIGTEIVHINGSFHANEWITTPVVMRFLNQYALSVTNNIPIRGLSMLPLFHNKLLSIVPMVNPDGVNLVINGSVAAGTYEQEVLKINDLNKDFSNWKANIHGVDLNNQFPALWEKEAKRKPTSPQPRDYPGAYPLSEPEALTMAELAKKHDFSRMNAFHTQGEVIYWGFEGLEPMISKSIANEYGRISRYTPVQYVDSYAGYKDWFIQEFRRPGFTIELGRGINPLPINQFAEIYERSLGIMLANLYL